MSTATLSPADLAAREASSYVRRRILARFPAGGPRGQFPAEERARQLRLDGMPAEVVMDLASDAFLVIVRVAS
jgi:hypothetical protein